MRDSILSILIGKIDKPEFPCAVVKAVGGDPHSDYLPYSVYSVDVLTYGAHDKVSSDARRLAYRINDTLRQAKRQRIAAAGIVNSLSCTVPPLQIWSTNENRIYYAQTWDIEIGHITGVD